jgi:hypothetical protein
MNFWQHLLPYAPAITTLVGTGLNVRALQPCKGDALVLRTRVVTAVAEFVALLAIAWIVADAAVRAGVGKAVTVGGIFVGMTLLLPRLVLDPVIERTCRSCNGAGKFGVGFVAIFVVALINNTICSAMMLGT